MSLLTTDHLAYKLPISIKGIIHYELSYDEKLVERQAQEEPKAGPNKQKKESARPQTEKVLSKYLTISGYASSMGDEGTALIGKFIKALKEDRQFYSDFRDIELGVIKRDKVDNQEVMNFTITCFFKESK